MFIVFGAYPEGIVHDSPSDFRLHMSPLTVLWCGDITWLRCVTGANYIHGVSHSEWIASSQGSWDKAHFKVWHSEVRTMEGKQAKKHEKLNLRRWTVFCLLIHLFPSSDLFSSDSSVSHVYMHWINSPIFIFYKIAIPILLS
jgi:hypothetical protein